MTTELIVGIVAAVALVIAAIIGAPRVIRDPINSLAKQVEIYNALPEGSAAHTKLMRRIEERIDDLDSHEKARRNPMGVALGVSFLIIAAALTWLVWSAGGWWWLSGPLLFILWLMGIVGFAQGIVRAPRTASGSLLKYEKGEDQPKA